MEMGQCEKAARVFVLTIRGKWVGCWTNFGGGRGGALLRCRHQKPMGRIRNVKPHHGNGKKGSQGGQDENEWSIKKLKSNLKKTQFISGPTGRRQASGGNRSQQRYPNYPFISKGKHLLTKTIKRGARQNRRCGLASGKDAREKNRGAPLKTNRSRRRG